MVQLSWPRVESKFQIRADLAVIDSGSSYGSLGPAGYPGHADWVGWHRQDASRQLCDVVPDGGEKTAKGGEVDDGADGADREQEDGHRRFDPPHQLRRRGGDGEQQDAAGDGGEEVGDEAADRDLEDAAEE